MPRKKMEEEEIQANLLPVMNIMFLLIPALLMAMEFASMASKTVWLADSFACPLAIRVGFTALVA